MCQTVSDGLLRGSTAVACSSRASNESFTSSCSFLYPSSAKGLCRHHPHLAMAPTIMKAVVCCQPLTHVPKLNDHVRASNRITEQQFYSPDRWMEDCVCDIVRNINEAPFLHMLFDSKDSRKAATSQRLKLVGGGKLSVEEKWEGLKDCISRASPDGVILVHHLDESSTKGCCLRDEVSSRVEERRVVEGQKTEEYCKSTNLWGVLLLGRNIARTACYILKTTSAPTSCGSCTQFCLTKAKCFGPSWHEQIQNTWLLQTENIDHRGKQGI